MARRRARAEGGFVITLELVLIFTILGIGLLVGIVAIRNALFVRAVKKKATEVWVYDSSDPVRILGKAFDLDEHEAPRLFYIDRDVAWDGATANFRAVVGVREFRFTSRHRIFYENTLDCGISNLGTVNACIVHAGDEDGDNLGVGIIPIEASDGVSTVTGSAEIQEAGGIGYLYPLQSGPSYGIGRDVDDAATGIPGTLFRETADSCDPGLVRSVWTSQTVVSGEACRTLSAGLTVTAAKCPPGSDGANLGEPCDVPPADSRCVTAGTCSISGDGCATTAECGPFGGTCSTGTLQCACPNTANGSFSDNWVEFGSNCCPPGTIEGAPGQCEIANDGTLRVAEPVQTESGVNVFSIFEPPFHVNLPPDNVNNFFHVQPGATEGENVITGIPYEGSGPIDFSSPADGVEGTPP